MENVERMPIHQVVENKGKLSLLTRATVAIGSFMLMGAANAAGEADLDITALTGGLTSSAGNAKLMFAGALVLLALFVAWRYTKRGANSA